MERFRIAEDINLQVISLKIKDREAMIQFYKQVIGLVLKNEENSLAIFSAQPTTSRLLVLDEMEAGATLDRNKVLVHFTLLLPTQEEFVSLAGRVVKANYPVDRFYQTKTKQVMVLKDPEENKIEIVYERKVGHFTEKEEGTLNELLEEKQDTFQPLSATVHISSVLLNVQKLEESFAFYHSVLGLSRAENDSNAVTMNEGKFTVFMQEAEEYLVVDKKLRGLDFLGCALTNKRSIEQLKAHLEQQNEKFYIDHKQSILTIYDPSGIEWWFLRKKIQNEA